MHWADVLADEVAKRAATSHVFATAITPSGPIHVGNMREVLTTEMVYRSARRRGLDAELLYIADSYDPLRKVYPFLDAAKYEPYVGMPLSDIPCPCGSHASYADHYLRPFLDALAALGIRPRVLLAHEMYRSGMYLDAVRTALDHAEVIREILERVAGRKLPEGWLPFNVQCERCGRLNGVVPTVYEFPTIETTCACGHEGTKDVRKPGGGKLPWRIDWPARWSFLGVTFEAMGKDHAAAGSSWDTGIEIARKVYRCEPPVRTVYEFIQLKGRGAMHSSTGTALAAEEMLRMTPPEVLRFLIARPQPNVHIDFDPGAGLLELVDEYDRWEEAYFAAKETPERKELLRVYELAQPGEVPKLGPPRIPFSHLVSVVRTYPTPQAVFASLERQGLVRPLDGMDEEMARRLLDRTEHARYWLAHFAPDDLRVPLVRFDVAQAWERRRTLSESQRGFLDRLGLALHDVVELDWRGDRLQDLLHQKIREASLAPADGFGAMYWVLTGARQGPRAGDLLALMPKDAAVTLLGGHHEPRSQGS